MFSFLKKIFDDNERELKRLSQQVAKVNSWEKTMQALSDDELRAKTAEFKVRLNTGETLEDLLPEALRWYGSFLARFRTTPF